MSIITKERRVSRHGPKVGICANCDDYADCMKSERAIMIMDNEVRQTIRLRKDLAEGHPSPLSGRLISLEKKGKQKQKKTQICICIVLGIRNPCPGLGLVSSPRREIMRMHRAIMPSRMLKLNFPWGG